MKVAEGPQYQNPPPGTHVARCISLIDLGTQPVEWQGAKKYQRKVRVTWELPDTKMDDGRPFSASRRYTFTLDKRSALRKDLEAWRGGVKFTPEQLAGFELKVILGTACQLTLVEQGDYVNVSSVAGIPKGMKVPPQVNVSVFFSLDPAEFDVKSFGLLSEKTRELITASPEYAALVGKQTDPADHPGDADADAARSDSEDDVPF